VVSALNGKNKKIMVLVVMVGNTEQNGWNEYSRLVLNELKRLDESCKTLNENLVVMNTKMAHLQSREDQVDKMAEDVRALSAFRSYAIGLFTVAQLSLGAVVAWILKGL